MLLDSTMVSKWTRHGIMMALLTMLQAISACAADPQLPCFIEVPVYDPHGVRLPFEIIAVNPAYGDTKVDLLKDTRTRHELSTRGDHLFFAESVLRRSLNITLSDDKGAVIKRKISLWGCQQRWSIQHGRLETGGDSAWSLIKGRIHGCPVTGDWWIRAMPMFEMGSLSYEGYISRANGSFEIAVGEGGGRHILVIGKDRAPVKVLAIDVVGAGMNDAGTVDLAGSCPQ
ncbi:MAG: hypothetical protein AB1898_25150 [Acidobacteriota bacterium]